MKLSLFASRKECSALALVTLAAAMPLTLIHAMADAPQGGLLYFVNTTSDTVVVGACQNGNPGCSLRGAIQTANAHPGADGISIDIPTSDPGYNGIFWTIRLTAALPDLTEGVDISGPGASKLTVRRDTGGNYRIFNVTTTGLVTLSGMTIRDGNLGGIGASGGGIASSNASAILQITNCALLNNAAPFGGGIYNAGTLTLTNCTLSGNSTNLSDGGGTYNTGSMTVTACAFNNNTAQGYGGGIYSSGGNIGVTNCALSGNSSHPTSGSNPDARGGGLFINSGTGTINKCAVTGNSATGMRVQGNDGNGLGGGVYVNSGTTNIVNCTLGSNSATGTGSISRGGAIFNQGGTVNITNSTLSKNSGQNGGGGAFNNAGGTANIKSSIIALNLVGPGPDVNGTFIAQGFNLIGKNDGAAASFPAGNPNGNNDIVGTSASPIDPKLDPNGLQNNGGPTQTIALLFDSPAIDKGTHFGSTGTLSTDQRGVGYSRTIDDPSIPNAAGGDGADVGAFEFGAHINVVSRKTHGATMFDIALPLTGVAGIECRTDGMNGDHQVITTFPTPVTTMSAIVTTGTGSASGFSVSGAQVTVNLTGVTNAQTIVLTLFGVSDGTNTNNVSVPVSLLLGDATGNGSVNSTDVSLTKSKSGQAIDSSNFREDVTVSNSINSSDVSTVKSKSGTALP